MAVRAQVGAPSAPRGTATHGPSTHEPFAPLRARDAALACAVLAAACVVWCLSPPSWLWGDGNFLLERFAAGRSTWMHLAYLPLARALTVFEPFTEPAAALRAASGLGAALGLAFSFLVARRVGARVPEALLATASLAFAPAVWFFALQVEVHGTQFAALAVAVWLVLVAPWRRFALALVVAAFALGLAHLGHQSAPALGPGWVLLVGYAAYRGGVALTWKRLVLVVGPALLAGLVAADLFIASLGEPAVLFGDREIAKQFAAEHHHPPSLAWWRADVLVPLGLAAFAVLAGAARLTADAGRRFTARLELGALVLLVGVPMFLFALWAVDNRGGYLAASAPFLVWLAARAVPANRARAPVLVALALLVAGQALHGWRDARAEAARFDRARHERRAAAVRAALPAGGWLISYEPDPQSVRQFVGDVGELQWLWPLDEAVRQGESPEALAQRLVGELLERWNGEALAVDRAQRGLADAPELAPWRDRAAAIDAALLERFREVPVDGLDWPIARLMPR